MYISPLAQLLYSILATKLLIKSILILKGLLPTDVFSTYPDLIRKALLNVNILITLLQARQIVLANELAIAALNTAKVSALDIQQAQLSYQELSNRLTQVIG